jgi:transcriptional regulator
MYVPPNFSVTQDAAWGIVRDAGAGTLVIATLQGLASVFVPVIASDDRRTVLSHVARANPWWRSVEDGTEVLAIFLAASAYVSPSNYPSRVQSPGVVPTWNYVACELRGRLHVHDDAQWLANQVRELTRVFEASRSLQWRVSDAPSDFIDQQIEAIVGIEIEVVSIEGKAKLSQNRPEIDHDSVRENFAQGTLGERNVARRMSLDE